MTYTVDYDDEAQVWVITKRDETMMPVDTFGEYATEAEARRAMAQRKYADKTRRPVIRK